jgi:hypothetical protein
LLITTASIRSKGVHNAIRYALAELIGLTLFHNHMTMDGNDPLPVGATKLGKFVGTPGEKRFKPDGVVKIQWRLGVVPML